MRLFLYLKKIAALNQQKKKKKKAEYSFVSAFYLSIVRIDAKDRIKFEMNWCSN